jgi:hypothetical protein
MTEQHVIRHIKQLDLPAGKLFITGFYGKFIAFLKAFTNNLLQARLYNLLRALSLQLYSR